MAKHITRIIVQKEADVDVRMIPIVRWINSYPEAITLYCCQGNWIKTTSKYHNGVAASTDCYVMWIARDVGASMVANEIITTLSGGTTEVRVDDGVRFYLTRWKHEHSFLTDVKRCKRRLKQTLDTLGAEEG